MSADEFVRVIVTYRAYPVISRPWVVQLEGKAVIRLDRRGRSTGIIESQPTKHVASCSSVKAANAAGARAAERYGLPFTPWTDV